MAKMKDLKSLIGKMEDLEAGLMHNGLCHQNYKVYTSMDKALQFILTGELYFSDGSYWNDVLDREQMALKESYALCTSVSTKENVAMWMLYADNRGKNGVVINLPNGIVKQIVNVQELQICKVCKGCKDEIIEIVPKDGCFSIYCTDILYTSEIKNDPTKIKIHCNGENQTISKSWLKCNRIFSKKYEWKYENESRIVIELSKCLIDKIKIYKKTIEEENKSNKTNSYLVLKIKMPRSKKIKEDRIIRSPVYEGNISYGEDSALIKEIIW